MSRNIHNMPIFLRRPRLNEMTKAEKIIAGQARSIKKRKDVTITLPKAPWTKERTQ